jgi:hypothetical protein
MQKTAAFRTFKYGSFDAHREICICRLYPGRHGLAAAVDLARTSELGAGRGGW